MTYQNELRDRIERARRADRHAAVARSGSRWPYGHDDPLTNRCAVRRGRALMELELERLSDELENHEHDAGGMALASESYVDDAISELRSELES